ncbi:MAG: DM13 domain-containing protein [Armatimonadaceae bacterium]
MSKFTQNKRFWLILLAVPVLAIGWFLFRPELLFVNQTVNESLPTASAGALPANTAAEPTAEPKLLRSGAFESLAHQTKGTAGIYEINGKNVLRLTGFETSNGPDVRVYLVKGTDGKDNNAINAGGFVELGTLKGNIGDQNYEIPANIDLGEFSAVSIWCKRFAVNFGAASLR